jgi:cysteine-rich repeat protein
MRNINSSPKVVNCVFIGNSATGRGGGMYNEGGNPDPTTPMVVNCAFLGNTAGSRGGGMANRGSHPVVTNCVFSGNTADEGGAMRNNNGDPTVVNCTFSMNSANAGGALYDGSSFPTVTNSVFWENSDSGGTDESAQINDAGGGATDVMNSCIQGLVPAGMFDNGTNIGDDPMFVDPDGGDNVVGTDDDNLRLQQGSPCINAGDDAAVPPDTCDLDGDFDTTEKIPIDLDGNARFAGVVDMGAYEFPGVCGNGTVEPGEACDDGNSTPCDGCDTNCQTEVAAVIYVDADAAGNNDGTSWCDAFRNLQDALGVASACATIKVAQGTYMPDGGRTPDGGAHVPGSGDRTATFQLKDGVTIEGGYAGCGEPDPDARDIAAHETIVGGDLSGDDGPNFANNGENSYHVVTGSGTDGTAVLDGFTIGGGNADGGGAHNNGGGMRNESGSPSVLNCTFTANWAEDDGAGMHNTESSPTVTDCMFTYNRCNTNATGAKGAAMANISNSNSKIVGCTFFANVARDGAAMYNINSSSPNLTNCLFKLNVAQGGVSNGGGAIRNEATSNPTIVNCMFWLNSVTGTFAVGGAIANFGASPDIRDSTFSMNAAKDGGGIRNEGASNPSVTNCILWDNSDDGGMDQSAQISDDATSATTVNYSCIQGGWSGAGGVGNIASDPMFVNVFTGDLRLFECSPCIDRGNNLEVPSDTCDLDGDGDTTEPIPLDLAGNLRFQDDLHTPDRGNGTPPIIDMGAYEGAVPTNAVPSVSAWALGAGSLLFLTFGSLWLRRRAMIG